MTYQEAKFIVKETEKLITCYLSNSSIGLERYHKIIPEDIYPSKIDKMNIEDIAEIINAHYGIYQSNDVVTDKQCIPCLITHIDYSNAETLHEVKYHVLYCGGITNVLHIDDITTKLGSVYNAISEVNKTLDNYFNNEINKIANENNK